MNVARLFREKQEDLTGKKPITIAFLGDSVTQGCFETYLTPDGRLFGTTDYPSAYSTRLREMLALLYPTVQVNIITAKRWI